MESRIKLEPVYYHKEQFNELYSKAIISNKGITFNTDNFLDYDFTIKSSNWSEYQNVVIVDDEIIGYVSAENYCRTNVSNNVSALLFKDEYKREFGIALKKFLIYLYHEGINLIVWKAIDHPNQKLTNKMYNRINNLLYTNSVHYIPEYYLKGRKHYGCFEYSIHLHFNNKDEKTPFEKLFIKA